MGLLSAGKAECLQCIHPHERGADPPDCRVTQCRMAFRHNIRVRSSVAVLEFFRVMYCVYAKDSCELIPSRLLFPILN